MKLHVVKWLLLGVLAIVPIGCEPRPVVVDDDADGATIIEDDDADTMVTPDTTPAPADSDQGVDVNINDPQTTPPASGSDANQESNPNANQ